MEAWQMPQGGIDPGESPEQAALRELKEETGINDDAVKLLGAMDEWLYYELPPDLAKTMWKGKYKGQRQMWFAFVLTASDDVINIHTEAPEFARWQWADLEAMPAMVVPFKRPIYEHLVEHFVTYRDGL